MNTYHFDIYMELDAKETVPAIRELEDAINQLNKTVTVVDSSVEEIGWGIWESLAHVGVQAETFYIAHHIVSSAVAYLNVTKIREV